jgi:PAS domain S-box-containing protein
MDRLRILVAEFDSATIMDLRKRLERAGHEFVGLVRSGPELLHRVREIHPDVVLLNPGIFRPIDPHWAPAEVQELLGSAVVFFGKPPAEVAAAGAADIRPIAFLRQPFDDSEFQFVLGNVAAMQRLRSGVKDGNARLEALAALLSDCAYSVVQRSDGSYVLEWLSDSFERITGYPPSEMDVPQGWRRLVYRDDLPAVERHLEHLHEGRVGALEFRLIRIDGSTRWIRNVARPVLDSSGSRVARVLGVVTDITESKRLQAAVQQGEERWRFAIDASGEAVWDWNVQTGNVFYSDRWKEMMGVRDDDVAPDMSDWDRRIHPDDQKRVHDEIRRYFKGDTQQFESEYRIRTGDDSLMWILDRGKIVGWTDDGKPARVIGTRKDITRRKQMEDALAMANDFLRDILESSTAISIVSTDPKGNILFWNSGAENLLGFRAEEMVGQRNIEELYAPDNEETQKAVQEMREIVRREKRTVSRTLQEIHRDGRALWVKVTVAPRLDSQGNVKGLLGIGEDVTSQMDAQRESEQRERQMRLLAFTLNCASDGCCITDLSNVVLYANDAFLSMYGYAEEEVLGRQIGMLNASSVTPEDIMEIAVSTQGGGWSGEILNRRKDGSEFPVELSTSVVRNDQGEPVALVAFARDITERKKADERLRASLTEKEVLLKEIHHRVKNNLQVITSLLNLQSSQEENPRTAAALRESQARVRSMALVHEELYRSRDLSRIDVANYTSRLTSSLLRVYKAPGADVDIQVDVHGVFLPVDAAIPCGLIINELVSNSLKYAFRSSGKGTIVVRMVRAGDECELTVSDDGEGLPPSLDINHTDSLGLQLVTTLAKQLRGTLSVDRGNGVSFSLRFPESEKVGHG